MPRVDAIVTGFAKSKTLAELSLAPLRRLQQEGVLGQILCVTWNDPSIDSYAGWAGCQSGIVVARIPQPQLVGSANRRGLQYQTEQLKQGLTLLPEAGLILKTRPDFIVDSDFLRHSIAAFGSWGTIPPQAALGVAMPKSKMRHRIWIPWADSNQPFYYEDALFLGDRLDIARLVTTLSEQDCQTLDDPFCGSFVHAVRYAKLFVAEYPLFARYLTEYRFFQSDIGYRRKLVPTLLNDGFFWHLLIAHAWILRSHFHVDAGNPGQLRFYSNRANPEADWSRLETLSLANPYDSLEIWRAGTHPDQTHTNLHRTYGRLVDNSWQRRLFVETRADFPQPTLKRILENIAACRDGRLQEIENNFYRGLATLHRAAALELAASEALPLAV